MRLCILASNENVEAVRAKAKEALPNMPFILTIPTSATGEMPATHWFCNMNVSDEMLNTLMSLKNLSEMEVSDSRKFLKEKGLKFIIKDHNV